MNINQIIYTIQGEGKYLGVPSLLIRTQGCNLHCSFCDTKHALNDKHSNDINFQKEINYYVSKYRFDNIMITGGEPFLQISTLLSRIRKSSCLNDKHIEIETNGTLISGDTLNDLNSTDYNITINLSPKFDPDSYKEIKNYTMTDIMINYIERINLLQQFDIDYVVKFIYDEEDEETILKFIELNRLIEREIEIYVMTKTENNEMNFEKDLKTVKFCKEHNLIYTPRIHLPLFKKDINEES